jgi:hypothetical protein
LATAGDESVNPPVRSVHKGAQVFGLPEQLALPAASNVPEPVRSEVEQGDTGRERSHELDDRARDEDVQRARVVTLLPPSRAARQRGTTH